MARPRAFSLVVVLLLGLGAFVIATTLLVISESASTRAAHTLQGNRAAAIAEAGLARARTHLQGITTINGDFDRVLDPDDQADCSGLPGAAPTAPSTSQVLRPKLADGVAVVYRGKTWTRVAFDDGAYLMRFEDDNDDFRAQSSWTAHTDNSPGVGNCLEGPISLGTADNPFRDRNQTIALVVLGISPGTDPDRAVHRSTLRRMERLGGATVVAGIQVDGNIDMSGNSTLDACSPLGSMVIDGNLSADGSSTGCACGDSRADGISGSWSHCSATAGRCGGVGCASGTLDTPGPNVAAAPSLTSATGKDFYFDWSRPCVFYVDVAKGGLWFWDATATRGPAGVACSTLEGSGFGFPAITPNDPSQYGQCWTPLLVGLPGGTGTPTATFGVERGAGDAWTPSNATATATVASINGLLGPAGYPTFPGGGSLQKPAWGSACTVAYLSDPPRGCTTCDGATVAMKAESGSYWFSGDSAAELHAIPAGSYFYDQNVTLTGGGADFLAPAPGTAPLFETFNLADWPLMTVAVNGNLTLQTRTFLGIGQADAAFASAVIEGNLTFTGSADKFIAGSVWSTGNWDWGGGSDNFFYGELHLNGNWLMSGNGQFRWRYLNALSLPTSFSAPTTPTQHLSLD